MNVRNCRKCGRMFNYITGMPVCPTCREAMEAKFQEVKEYIREHKGAGINEVAEACEIETAQITQWLREDRLELAADSAVMINCEKCGAPIRSGKYCDKCRANMTNSLNRMAMDINTKAAASAAAHVNSGFRNK
ncbi:MAG: flagellar protein [Lachnospiraceae bacterium]|nr:flagellar protein [Lachnospiraceae bacterium]